MVNVKHQTMNNQNARDFLRQSIAGSNAPLLAATPIAVPPILVIPPGVGESDFIAKVETAYDLNYHEAFAHVPTDELTASRVEHALLLMDKAIAFALADNYQAASDLFSLCVILDNNYFYNYCLGSVRFYLEDYSGALNLVEKSLQQIRDKQKIDTELMSLSQDLNFAENLYTLYVLSLIFNSKVDRAVKTVHFALSNQILQSPALIIDLIGYFQFFNENEVVAILSKTAMASIEKIEDQEIKDLFLNSLKDLLASKT